MSKENTLIDKASVAVATGLYLSYIPFWLTKGTRAAKNRRWTGAGFLGTVLGWVCVYALPIGWMTLGFTLVVAIVAASIVCGRAEKVLGTHDDSRIILDETVGYWAAVAWLPREPMMLLMGFVLFRFFDAVKLQPYKSFERLPGGYGVVMDDVGAGIVTNLVLRSLCIVAPGWLP